MRARRTFWAVLAMLALFAAPVARAQGVVTSADPRASEAGRDILRQGGSATDAALAMMLALAVVEPQSSGIGGGGFFVHHDATSGAVATIDGRETAPAAARADRFLDLKGVPLPFAQAFPGGQSVGVPGNVALMAKAHARWGKLPWSALFTPAIRLARDGFVVNARLHDALVRIAPIWADFPAARALYWRGGAPVAVGDVLRNPALASVLEDIAARGPDAFYRGQANAIAVAVASAPGATALTPADLAAYQAKERPAVCGRYRVYRICGMGPPSSGATTVLQILGMVERFNLARMGRDDPRAWQIIGQAMRLAYADRDLYLGDADFVPVPVQGLIERRYVRQRARLIHPGRALASYKAGQPRGAAPRQPGQTRDVPGTTHFIAVDAAGDIASMTSTVEGPFGSQIIVNGYVLNNELTDFAFAPARDGVPVANRVEPGKRPLSSMAPTIVYDRKGRAIFSVGAAGGRTIIMQVAKALIAHLDWKMPADRAIASGLLFFDRDGLVIEQGSDLEPMKSALEALGETVRIAPLGLKANAVERTSSGWTGAADPRSPGVALVP